MRRRRVTAKAIGATGEQVEVAEGAASGEVAGADKCLPCEKLVYTGAAGGGVMALNAPGRTRNENGVRPRSSPSP